MMYQKSVSVLVLLLVSIAVAAQTRGRVVDSDNAPVDYATIVVQTIDSTFVAAAVTDSEGYFTCDSPQAPYRIVFQHVLFKSLSKEFAGHDAGTTVMEEKDYALNEVIIKAERPQVKVENGALVYDVSAIAEKNIISNAYESILYLPGVIEQSEGFALAGASTVTVVLNGKPTSMSNEQLANLLKSTPVSTVEKAEVIYNAPAKYRVRGSVINIVLKNKKTEDPVMRGEVGAEYTQRHYAGEKGNLSLSFSNKKLAADFLYSADYRKIKSGTDLFSNHTVGGSVYEVEQFNSGHSRSLTHNGRLGLDYKINEKNKLSIAYTTAISGDNKSVQRSEGNISRSDNTRTGSERMHNANVDYTADFGLNLGVDYTHYNTPSTQDFTDRASGGEQTEFMADAEQTINRWKIYAGQTHELKNGWGLNYGTEMTFVRDKNAQIYYNTSDPDLSDLNTSSKLNEETYNIYAGLEKTFSQKLSFTLSAAGEYYKMEDYSKWSVYPTALLSYTPSANHIVQVGFSSDKSYPDYWSMQEQTGYLNGYAEIHGNPHLKPAKNYEAGITYILKRKYIAKLYYERNPDMFQQLPYQDPNRLSLIYQTVNYDHAQNIGLTLVIPFSVGNILNSRLTLDGSYNKAVCDAYHDISFNREKFIGIAQLNNSVRISSKPNIMLELNGMYVSPPMQGIYDLSSVWKVDAGLRIGFANPNMELRLKGNDLFNSFVPDCTIDYKGQNLKQYLKPDSRSVSVSFTYKFGGYKAKEHKAVDTSRFGTSTK